MLLMCSLHHAATPGVRTEQWHRRGHIGLQGIQVDDLQAIMDVNNSSAAYFGQDMCLYVGELVTCGIFKKHGIALIMIRAG